MKCLIDEIGLNYTCVWEGLGLVTICMSVGLTILANLYITGNSNAVLAYGVDENYVGSS